MQTHTEFNYNAMDFVLFFKIKIPVPLGITDLPYRQPVQVNSDVAKCVLSGKPRLENSCMSAPLKKVLFPR